jgi:lipoate-protein ligase A
MEKLLSNKDEQSGTADKLSGFIRKQTWRLLDIEHDDPVINFAIEEAILEKVGASEAPNTIRFWRNLNTVVVVGKFQIPEFEINKEACTKYSATIMRRFTGGGTVYNDCGNLNYSIAVRRDDPIIPAVIAQITPKLCEGVVEGLRLLGLNAEFEPEGVYIHINGRKVSGTAGIVKRNVAFMHGTLLVNSNLAKLKEILEVPPYPSTPQLRRFVKSTRRMVTSIETELGREVTLDEVKDAIKQGFTKTLGIELQPGKLLDSELFLSKNVAARKRGEMVICSRLSQ